MTWSSGPVGWPGATQTVEVVDEGLGEVGAHLDHPNAAFGLRVRDVEARTVGVVESHITNAHVA